MDMVTPAFYMGAGDLNSALQACMAGSLPQNHHLRPQVVDFLCCFSTSSTLVLENPVTLTASTNPTVALWKSFRFSIHIIFYFCFGTGSQVSQVALKLAREQFGLL